MTIVTCLRNLLVAAFLHYFNAPSSCVHDLVLIEVVLAATLRLMVLMRNM